MDRKSSRKHFKLGKIYETLRNEINIFFPDFGIIFIAFYCRTPIITTKPSEDHTYSAYGSSAKPGNVVSTIVNVGPAEAEIQFNENNSPPIAPRQIQTKFDANSVNNHGTEIIIDNRHSDNMSNGTSSDAAYESSEER